VTDMAYIEERLRRLEDLEQIRQLFVDYVRYLDAGDFAAYAQLFAEQGEVLLGPLGSATGPRAIRSLLERALGNQSRGTRHIIANPNVEVNGDQATAEVVWLFLAREHDGRPAVGMLGRHRDALIREHGQWRFRRREGVIDIPSSWPALAGSKERGSAS
jgi:uncharacterized protein (TIGR02246 family)